VDFLSPVLKDKQSSKEIQIFEGIHFEVTVMNVDDYHGDGHHHMADEDYADKTEFLLDIIDSLESGDDRYHINDIIIMVKNNMSSLHDYVKMINNDIIMHDNSNTNDIHNHNRSHTHEYHNDNHNRDDKKFKLCQNYFIIMKLLIIISSKISSLTTDNLKLWKFFHQHFKQYHQYLSIQIIYDYCQLLHMYLTDGLHNLQQYLNHQNHQKQHQQHKKRCKMDKHQDINSSNTIIHDNSDDNSNDDNNRSDYNSSKKLISFFIVRYMYIMSMYRQPLSQLITLSSSSSSSSSSLLMDSIITLLRYQGIISYIHSLSSFNTNTGSIYTSTTTTVINNNDDDSFIYNANDIVICDELFMKNFEYICKLLEYNHHIDDDHQGRNYNDGNIGGITDDDNSRNDSANSNKLLFLLRCIQHESNNWIEDKMKLSYLIDGVMLMLQYIIKNENSRRIKERDKLFKRNDNHDFNNDDRKDFYNKDDGSSYIYECIYIFLQSMRFHCLFIDNSNTSNDADNKNKNYNNNNDISSDDSDDDMLIKYIKQFIKLLVQFMGSCDDHNSIRRLMVSKPRFHSQPTYLLCINFLS
jgi:hypothetical protein